MKKLLSILMVMSLLISTGAFSISAAEKESENYWIAETPDIDPTELPGKVKGLLGDADSNGTVNVKDATAVQKHVAGITEIDNDTLILADADLSGDYTVKDATTIQKWVAGLAYDYLVGHAIYTPYDVDKNILGTWDMTMDAADLINEMISLYSDDPLLAEHVNIEEFVVKQAYTFKEDGSYIINVDETVLASSVTSVKKELEGDMANYLEAYAASQGFPLTAQQMLSLMGYSSMAEFIEDMFPLELLLEAAQPTEGLYRTWNGRLYLDEYSDTYYEFYSISGNTMTITGNSEDTYADEYPIIFTKVK